ncbi:MAG: T9SS C-terminal target domain-containing protein [Saprospirales bacterium]|nr:MAG: T9SS C-terminal target domain-containing protein [Saprospirales bacterium]
MKKLFTLLAFTFTLAFSLPITSLDAQVQRMVVVEEFTNASCPPCASQNPAFNALLDQNLHQVVPIKYQTAFPGFDPYNQQNPGEVATRLAVYGINGVPTAAMDGEIPGPSYGGGGLGGWNADGSYDGGPYGYTQAVLDYAADLETHIEVLLDVEWNEDFSSADVNVSIINHSDEAFDGNNRLHILLLEVENVWPEPPGNTNERDFTHVMRKMYPDAQGTAIDSLGGGDTLNIFIEAAIPEYIYALSEMAFATFVQNNDNREIFNGAITDRVVIDRLYPNMGVVATNVETEGELCDRTADVSVVVENMGLIDVTYFDLIVAVGNEVFTFSYDELLEPGEQLEFSFDESFQLAGGSNVVSAFIDEVNNNEYQDANPFTNLGEPVEAAAIGNAAPDDFDYGFENDETGSNAPDRFLLESPNNNSFIAVVSRNSFQNAPAPVGGFGESEKSLLINFYQWQVPQLNNRGSITVMENVDIENVSRVEISFDRAHARYSGFPTSDRLEGYVSYDCGESWELVYSKSGDDLATSPAVEPFFVPRADQWETDVIVIEEPAGDELLFKFDVVSDWGNSLFIDNIKMDARPVSVTNNDPFQGSVSVFPNPSTDYVNIEFEIENESEMLIEVFNMKGQLIQVLSDFNSYSAGSHLLRWTPDAAGQYFVKFYDGKAQKVEMFTIVK